MANGYAYTTQQFSEPYLTIQEYKNAPTAIDIDNIVIGGNQSAQDAELANVILRASSWVDQYCGQILGATTDVEQQRSRINKDGTIRLHPKYAPIVALTAFSYGTDLTNILTSIDNSLAWIEESAIIFPYAQMNLAYSSQGPLQFGFPTTPQSEVYLKYSYVNGYTNTTNSTAVTAGDVTISVTNGTGITAGQMLRIYDGTYTENITVASTYTFGSNTVPLASGCLFSHDIGASVSALPAAIKEATILATTAFLKVRGDNSLVMAVATRGVQEAAGTQRIGSDLTLAQDLLKPFRRIR